MNRGFTLLELSIVLVITGLLTGGVMTGQALIRAAEIRSMLNESQLFTIAMITFRDKYHAIPGDMRNAIAFWGAADNGDGVGTDCAYAVSSGIKTCNGNGNGQVSTDYSGTVGIENFRFWQHLANAGLIPGNFTGAPSAAISPSHRKSSVGVNIPASKLGDAAWYVDWVGDKDGSDFAWAGNYDNVYIYGGLLSDDITEDSALSPAEAWNIDTKTDDGKPAFGRVRPYQIDVPCNSNASAATAAYKMTDTSIQCVLMIMSGQ